MVSIADYGNIHITRHGDIRGGVERYSYDIEGGPYVGVSGLHYTGKYPINAGDRFEIGPYKLRVVEYNLCADHIIAIQEKWPLWWIAVAWHKYSRLLDIFYRRMIVTLAVWRLADYSEATIPYIGDIHIVQRIRKLFNG